MKTLSERLDLVIQQSESTKGIQQDQLTKFEETKQKLEQITSLEKSSYDLPLVDTIGKTTYVMQGNG